LDYTKYNPVLVEFAIARFCQNTVKLKKNNETESWQLLGAKFWNFVSFIVKAILRISEIPCKGAGGSKSHQSIPPPAAHSIVYF
jgi:hypothetical protein